MKNLSQLIDLSLKGSKQKGYEINLTLEVDGEKYRAYECSVAHRDLLFFTDKGTLNYVVDTYGDKNVLELYSIDCD